ncbi:MAG: hypothetical protein NC131_21810 [Roseburia sp.]|nr:hypothetical protein [Roseburia sp.]
MKSSHLLLALMLLSTVAAAPRTIKSVIRTSGGIRIVDNRGRRSPVIIVANDSDLIGNNDAFCILRRGGEYQFFNPAGQRYLRLDTARLGKIFAVTGDTFSAGHDSIRTTYDSNCKVLSSRLIVLPDSADVYIDENQATNPE